MRNPWIARETFDRVVTLMEAQIERAENRVDSLTKECLALKRQGFHPGEPERQRDTSPDLPPVVMEAVIGRAGSTGNSLGTQLMAEAQRMLREQMDPEVVASRIWHGEAGEDE